VTLFALSVSYFNSVAFRSLNPSTQAVYGNIIESFCKQVDKEGNRLGSVSKLRREHIIKLMSAPCAKKPDSANGLRKVLRAMMKHAVEIGLRDDDPTRDVKAIRVRRPWREVRPSATLAIATLISGKGRSPTG
jgi:site-specific recombinase XerD